MTGSAILTGAAAIATATGVGAPVGIALGIANQLGLGSLIDHLLGDSGSQVADQVMSVARTALGGAEPTEDAIAGLPADQQVALKVQLAQIALEHRKADLAAEAAQRSAELDALKASLADVANARQQTTDLAKAGSAVQWAPAIVSFVVLGTFGIVMWAALTRTLPVGSETILNMLLGTLAAMATSTVSYWVGSSAGSAQKTNLLFRSTPTGVNS